MRETRASVRLNSAVVTCALASALAPSVMGQVQWDIWVEPPPSMESFQQCLQTLRLDDPAQELLLTVAYQSLTASFLDRVAQVEQARREVESRRNAFLAASADVRDPWMEKAEDFGALEFLLSWDAERRDLDGQLERTVRSLLDQVQIGVWDQAVRTLRRKRVLADINPFKTVRSAVDLLAILDSMKLADMEDDALASVATMYEAELDETLRHYEERMGGLVLWMLQCHKRIRQGELDARLELEGYQRQGQDLVKAVQDVNVFFVVAIASHLSEDRSTEFLSIVDKSDFPTLFAQSRVDAAIDLLRASGLPGNSRLAMESIYGSYSLQRSDLYRLTVHSTRKWNAPRELERREARRAELLAAGTDALDALRGHPGIKYLRRLFELERSTCRALFGLCPEQVVDTTALRLLLTW